MSLLMKALANAEENRRALQDKTNTYSQRKQGSSHVYTADNANSQLFSKLVTALIVALLLGIVWFAYQIYQLNKTESKGNPPLTTNSASTDQHQQADNTKALLATEELVVLPTETLAKVGSPTKAKTATKKTNTKPVTKVAKVAKLKKSPPTKAIEEGELHAAEPILPMPEVKAEQNASETSQTAAKQAVTSTDIKVEHKAGVVVTDKNLEQAYAAFQAGRYVNAKRLYRKVLKQDVGQVDALLGMAAIAQKQGRLADAGGWYKKALKVSPNNPVALAGMVAAEPKVNINHQEAKLKSLIAKQPTHAPHYANLGNLYASNNAWDKAQSAFFEASRYAKDNAQYAYNLAISLEHLGKPALAVQHYKRALAMVNLQQLTVPNADQIRQRINVLQ